MASKGMTAPVQSTRPRTRKSLAHVPKADGGFDLENQTVDLARPSAAVKLQSEKKTRSKSFGPGDLDALKETSGNRRKTFSSVVPKSILKPSIPLSPLREIPIRKPANRQVGSGSPSNNAPAIAPVSENTEVPVTPQKQSSQPASPLRQQTSSQDGQSKPVEQPDPETVERRRRRAEIQKQREERRKSMANRRVSFAPEATLHTWDTEILQESTTSSASTDPARRVSMYDDGTSDSPSTPPEQIEDDTPQQSPEHQRDTHQKKRRRRSSGVPPMNFNDPDALSSSPYSTSSAVEDDMTMESNVNEESPSSTPLSKNRGSAEEESEADDLDNSLQEAAERAGTRTIEHDENGDVSMEIVGDEVTAAFKPWVQQSMGMGSPHPRWSASKDQENVNIFASNGSTAMRTESPARFEPEKDEMSMDMTRPVGGILGNQKVSARRQSVRRRRSSGNASVEEDLSMDMTTALGVVKSQNQNIGSQSTAAHDENEDLSMEFTSIFGAIRSQQQHSSPKQNQPQPYHENNADVNETMEMTAAIGSVLPKEGLHTRPTNNDDKKDAASMDTTRTAGNMLPASGNKEQQALTSPVQSASSAFQRSTGARSRPPAANSAVSSPHAASPAHRSTAMKNETSVVHSTPPRIPQTPEKQLTPVAPRPATPSKTPPSANISMRKQSPKRLFKEEIGRGQTPVKTPASQIFDRDIKNGKSIPSIVLAPQSSKSKRNSGVGIDKEGLGSPSMAALLDRRGSLGDQAPAFAPQSLLTRELRFDDPKVMETEVTREREEDHRRESAQFIMEQEADGDANGHDTATSLRDMIQTLTPKKKKKLNGRKSLALGAAKGVLGKRPAELDVSDEDGSPQTVGKAGSPVKRVRLDGPTSAQKPRKSLGQTSGNTKPVTPRAGPSQEPETATTPTSAGRFKNAERLPTAQKPAPTMGRLAPADAEARADEDGQDDNISLQDFLNLTNIRFMDLNTTKRRATTVPPRMSAMSGHEGNENNPQKLFEDSAVAGSCTIPMLELYQHSCRELKKYISEGREVVHEIEAQTLEENPPLFKEYLDAPLDARATMDSQLKNMKTNARLMSKASWYEWRMKLLEGLRDSLQETQNGFAADESFIKELETAINGTLPAATQQLEALKTEHERLIIRGEELAGCDPEDLKTARAELRSINEELQTKQRLIEEHQDSLQDMDEAYALACEAQRDCHSAIQESNRLREESRGLGTAEVEQLQENVADLERRSGWRVLSAAKGTLVLNHANELNLLVDTMAFPPFAPNGGPSSARGSGRTVALSYVGAKEPSTVKRFMHQLMSAHIHSLVPAQTHIRALTSLITDGWTLSANLEAAVQQLELRVGVTTCAIIGDERLAVETMVLLPNVRTKVLVGFEVSIVMARGAADHASIQIGRVDIKAKVAYGEEYREEKMRDFVGKRVQSRSLMTTEWADAVVELRKGLIARGRKG